MSLLSSLCRGISAFCLRNSTSISYNALGVTKTNEYNFSQLRRFFTVPPQNKKSLLDHSNLTTLKNSQRELPTLSQLHRRGKRKYEKTTPGWLGRCPQKRAIVLKVVIRKPKKPNSANRKCARVKLSNGYETTAFIPGEGHNLQEHQIVLVQGGRLQDVPGVKVRCVRGKYDLQHVVKKKK